MSRYSIREHTKIMEDMKNTILSQELAMEDIGTLLREIHSDSGMIHGVGDIRSRIIKRILSGPSGVGKTETIKRLRYYLCMEPGDFNENQFIHIDGSVYKDVTQLNRIIGSGPGYAACDSNHTLVDDLIRAARSPYLTKIPAYVSSKPPDSNDTTYNLPEKKRQKSTTDYPAPKFILLFIDEIDKTHLDFMSIINGLLDEGSIKSSRGSLFVLPKTTKLIIIFTSNYGYKKISQMTLKHQQTAIGYVEDAMIAHGLAPNSIERFGTHIIFYPIIGENLVRVIKKKINTFFSASNPLTQNFGSINYTDAIQCICDFIIRITDPGQGIRNSVKHLHECLTPLLLDAFYKIQELPDEKRVELFSNVDTKSPTPVFNLFKETFHLDTFFGNIQPQSQLLLDNDQKGRNSNANNNNNNNNNNKKKGNDQMIIAENNSNTPRHIDIIEAIRRNIKNEANLEVFKSEKQDEIHAFGISKGDYVVNCVIVPLIVKQYTVTQYDTEASKEVIDKLQYDNRCVKNGYINLKKQYVSIRGAIRKGEVDKFDKILIQEPDLLEFSDDGYDDSTQNSNVMDLYASGNISSNNNNITSDFSSSSSGGGSSSSGSSDEKMESPKKKIKSSTSSPWSSFSTKKRKLDIFSNYVNNVSEVLCEDDNSKNDNDKKRKRNNKCATSKQQKKQQQQQQQQQQQPRKNKGVWRKQIDGFEYLHSSNGHAYYKCVTCDQEDIDKRCIGRHICSNNGNDSNSRNIDDNDDSSSSSSSIGIK